MAVLYRSLEWKRCQSILRPSHSVNKRAQCHNNRPTEIILYNVLFSLDLEIKSTCERDVNVTVIPDECCVVIEKDDVECGVREYAIRTSIMA
jgi:hypothetical protein